MSRVTLSAAQVVARSLKITRATHLVVASVAAAVTINAAVAVRLVGLPGQAVLLAVVFATLAVGSSAVSMDVYSRSSQAVSNLRSIGATRNTVSSAVAYSMMAYGAGGAALGGVVGVAIGGVLGGAGTSGGTVLVQMVAVIFVACAGLVAGAFAGARQAWSG